MANSLHCALFASTLLGLAAAQANPAGTDVSRLEVQANTFTRSTQDAATLAAHPDGTTVLAWQSRRQQEGAYGVYARRFGPDGAPLSDEVQVNATTAGHQRHPSLDLDEQGYAWFAWYSFGQDGSLGAIVARRFDPTLATATAEVIVNDIPDGNQTSPSIVALPGGGALVAWLDPARGHEHVRARRLAGDGTPLGEAFEVSVSPTSHRNPTMVVDGSGTVSFAYERLSPAGESTGIFLRTLKSGELSDEQQINVAGGVQAIEPALAATEEGLLAGWLETTGTGYGLRLRSIIAGVPGPVRELASGEGWTSGIALSLDGAGNGLVTWNQHADGEKRLAGLHALRVDAKSAQPAGNSFRVTARTEGSQAIAVATGGDKCALFGDGRMAFCWQGDAGGEDTSAVNLTLLAPSGMQLAAAAPVEAFERFEDPSEGAAMPSHDPPTFDPRDIDRDRSEEEGPAGGGIFDFLGFTSTGWTPPDPEMGVGPDHIVAMVNGGIAWFTKDGTQQFQQDINGSGGFWGSVGASGFVYDPEVVYDIHSQRFFVFASDGNAGFLLGVSDDSDPNGSWNKYLIPTSGLFGTNNVDSGNLAVDKDFVTITGDLFSPSRLAMLFIDKGSAMGGGPLSTTDTIIDGRHSMGTCTNQDTDSDTLYLTWAQEFTSATSIRIYAVTDRDTTPTVQFTTLTVPEYSHPNDPPQAGTSVRPELFEARFWSSMKIGGSLWAVHHEGSPRTRVQWYEIDLGSWPASGSPTLVQSSQFNFGAGIFTFFPSIWADAAGNAAITFNQSSSNDFISIQMVTRAASDPLGQMSAPILMRDGTAPDTSGRFGDYSATNTDPAQPGSFWGHHEYTTGSWRTRIGRIDTCPGGVTSYCSTSPNSAGSGALMGSSGSTSISANDLVLQVTAGPPGQFGLFFFGNQQQSTPLGDGTLCVAGNLSRFPVVTLDGSGVAKFSLNLAGLPGGVTLSPGDSLNFQFWFRDPPFGTAGYNLSDAIEAVFCN